MDFGNIEIYMDKGYENLYAIFSCGSEEEVSTRAGASYAYYKKSLALLNQEDRRSFTIKGICSFLLALLDRYQDSQNLAIEVLSIDEGNVFSSLALLRNSIIKAIGLPKGTKAFNFLGGLFDASSSGGSLEDGVMGVLGLEMKMIGAGYSWIKDNSRKNKIRECITTAAKNLKLQMESEPSGLLYIATLFLVNEINNLKKVKLNLTDAFSYLQILPWENMINNLEMNDQEKKDFLEATLELDGAICGLAAEFGII